MHGGRPTAYKPEYCELVIGYGKQGKSKAWMASAIGVVRLTLDNWIKAHPEFAEAMEIALLHSQQWWEDAGQNGMMLKSVDASIWSRSMAARFPADWREKSEKDLNVNGAINLTISSDDANL